MDPGKYLRVEKQLRGTARAEGKSRRKMLRAVGAGPTMVPQDPEAAEPDTTQES